MEQLNALVIVDYIHRRWDVHAMAGARARAMAVPELSGGRNPEVGFWNRDIAPAPSVVADGGGQLGRLEAHFLYCDTRPLTAGIVPAFEAALQRPYGATHLLWWLAWARELGCDVPAAITLERIADEVVADFAEARAVVDDTAVVNDLTIEQRALLAAAGLADRLPPDWPARVVSAQLPDGSWYEHVPNGSPEFSWHPTMLAVWYLLAIGDPDRPDPGFLAGRP
ncbi:MAG TPA: hypothetical protein VGE38_09195 [Nocardioides sp.]|uniref:hypothetical protein n=1 Tax=Nocardioides sp. TaxID=35761 RepID=UPI002ED7A78E